ncbi:MAG TPA: ATP-dependent helicase, partial [Armatimonadota bacterium]|nr:ATP-dependent helicase [Armatimonadota bacterium]
RQYGDFPILLEAWRTCLHDEFDLPRLRALLDECATGETRWSEVFLDAPSPFAQTMSWRQVNQYMYEDDTPAGQTASQLHSDLLREVVFSPELRPVLSADIADRFVAKRQRIAPGYAPQSSRELLDWVKERLLIPQSEWKSLLQAIRRDHGIREETLLHENAGKLLCLHPVNGDVLIAATEDLPRLRPVWGEHVAIESMAGELATVPQNGTDIVSDDEDSSAILGEWLRFYGPVSLKFISSTLGFSATALAPVLDDLLDTQKIIQGRLTDSAVDDELCDSENYEILLRMARAAAVPEFTPLPCEQLPLFLASQQGICRPGERIEELAERLEQLSGYPAKAELWEADFLPTRMKNYEMSWLDSLLQQGNFCWIGAGKEHISICLPDDLPLLRQPRVDPATDDLHDVLPDAQAHYPLHALSAKSNVRMHDLVARLWEGVWNGIVGNDSMATLRQGILQDFQTPKLPQVNQESRQRRHIPRGGFNRWATATPFAGNWYRLPEPVADGDVLDQEERAKDWARLLLDRYGILFKELVQWEVPAFQWSAVFRALRLLELAGEVLAGCFFTGIPGLQFCSHEAFRALQRSLPTQTVWWVNACDPASCCGIQLQPLKGKLPRRVPGNYLVFRGSDPVLFIQKNGKELQFHLSPDDPVLQQCLAPIHTLLERRFQPMLRLTVETINGENACASPYLPALAQAFDVVRDMNRIFLAPRRS